MTDNEPAVDCHAHIIDPARFPFAPVVAANAGTHAQQPPRGYRPRFGEHGTREEFCAILDQHGIGCGLLVQLSGYETNNGAILDAVKTYPGRFKAIVVVDPDASDTTLEELAAAGAVGARFNLPSYDPAALMRPDAPRLLARLKALGWFAQVFADDAQWAQAAPVLRESGVRVLIDHMGVKDIARGLDQPGFQSVLALGREGNAVVKLSGLFRSSRGLSGFEDLDPFVEQLLNAFGIDGCVWGSDWPFTSVPQRPQYGDLLAPLSRWLPHPADRQRVLAHNPHRLFGFGS
jgi:predicted TIM-barrel fold metal-dependent hydrolase